MRIPILGSVLFLTDPVRMRIREAQKHPDPDADSEHWYKDKKSYRNYKKVEIKVFLTIFA